MKKKRVLLFTAALWSVFVVPTFLMGSTGTFIENIIIGSGFTVPPALFLALWSWLQKRFKLPRVSLALPIFGLVIAISLVIFGISSREPLIWEGIVPLILILFPFIILGFILGLIWEKWILK